MCWHRIGRISSAPTFWKKSHRGVLTGAPLTDVRVTLLAGRAHLKHTPRAGFPPAVYRAVRQGLMQAESVLLEPWYSFHGRGGCGTGGACIPTYRVWAAGMKRL